MNIYVANLSFELRDEDLKELFVSFGEVSSARIIVDKMTDRSRGFGFVEMTDDAAGRKAIAELNGATVEGRPLKVNEANPKPEGKFNNPSERNYNNSQSYNQTIY
ncbi:RNA recognition motif domain-containing protein [Puia dinghuensis]|uniref:RNA-binding protein n=1 Tax=Puia dinghuensis TaxID=1792502 RepID=A0A8J2XQV0_9BACT|nr:RNA-binding protein [Puia dinghuensis]GGA86516.1 RNA-binding protein [Puia dinghuensis]